MPKPAGASTNATLALVFAYLSLVPVLTSCQRTPDPPSGGVAFPRGALVVLIGPSLTDPSWPGIRGGALRYDERYPTVDCLTTAPASDDPAALAELTGQIIARHPVAVCLCVTQPRTARPAAEQIVRAGILLVTVGQPIDGVEVYGHIAVGWPQAAEMLGSSLGSFAGELPNPNLPHIGPSYVLIHDDGRDPVASQCYSRFIVAARTKTSLSLLTQRNAAATGRSPRELVDELLAQFPSVRLIVTLNPEPWLSLQPRFRLPAANRFATLAAPPRLWPRLQSGEAAALAGPLDGDIGFAALDMAVKGVMQIPDAPTRRVIPCELVTSATLADFAQRYAAAANLDVADLAPYMPATHPASQAGGE